MKKIRLNVASMNATEILSRDQLKTIFGGGSDSGTNTCNWYYCWCKNSSSGVVLDTTSTLQASDAVEAVHAMDCSYLYSDTGCTVDRPC